jgi:glycerol-3-phosphate acyltransferase PlsX
MKIGLDVMGGDYAPDAVIQGAVDSIQHLSEDEILVLIGNESTIRSGLNALSADPTLFEIVNTTQVIEMADHPAKSFSQKKHSSLAVGYGLPWQLRYPA